MTERFEFSFRYSRADYMALTAALSRRPWPVRFTLAAVLALVVLGVLLALSGSIEKTGFALLALVQGKLPLDVYALLALIVLGSLFSHYVVVLMAAMIYRSNALADKMTTLTVDAGGIEGGTPDLQSHIAWSAIRRVIETPQRLILAISKREGLVLPRRAFADDDDFDRLKAFVRQQSAAAAS